MPVQPGEVRMNKGALFSLATGRYFMRYRGRLHEELSCRGGTIFPERRASDAAGI